MLFSKLLVIKNEYLQARLRELGVDSIPLRYVELLNNDNIILNYIKDIKFMLNKSAMCDINLLDNYNDIIFEGAQGLLLDQNSKYFPNVTPSNTGMKNVEHIINTLGYNKEDIEIIYVTRNYVTRHGIGKFETELEEKPYYNIIDLTNIPNEYQGILRFGLLDINSLKETIDNDLKYAKTLNYKKSLAITCLDQVDNEVKYIYNGENITSSIDEFINNIKSTTGIFTLYLSYGVTRDTIRTNISI
jgi:adenylosuccinate synthase